MLFLRIPATFTTSNINDLHVSLLEFGTSVGCSEEGGHGTHVSGTLAGAQSDTSAGEDEADGGAFQGKLAVFDFGDSDNNNALTTPDQVINRCRGKASCRTRNCPVWPCVLLGLKHMSRIFPLLLFQVEAVVLHAFF